MASHRTILFVAYSPGLNLNSFRRVSHTGHISSLKADAKRILNAKRAHWGIENGLHWVMDVAFQEDKHQLHGNGAANMAVLRHMALSLLKQGKTAKCGIHNKRLKVAWDENYLLRIWQAS